MAHRSVNQPPIPRRRSQIPTAAPSPFPLLALALVIAAMLFLRDKSEPPPQVSSAPALAALPDAIR